MGTKTVRIDERYYDKLCRLAAGLDTQISGAANVALHHGIQALDWETSKQNMTLEPDLQDRHREAESDEERNQVYLAQYQRNIARSELVDAEQDSPDTSPVTGT
jgi:hypothetical protein